MAFTTTCLWISKFVDQLTSTTPNIPFHRLRLVMPPTLFFLLSFPVTRLAHALFPASFANGAISGAFVFCKLRAHFVVCHSHLGHVDVIYDSMHYAYATFRFRVRVFLTRSSFPACITPNFQPISGSRKSIIWRITTKTSSLV